jgi:hypothetical protein
MYNDLIFMALCAFEQGGISDFRYSDIPLFKEGVLGRKLKELEDEGKIKNITINGYYPRYEIYSPVECPAYIFDNRLTVSDKYKLHLASNCSSISKFREAIGGSGVVLSKFRKKLEGLGISDILTYSKTCESVKREIGLKGIIKTDKGVKFSTKKYDCICSCCGKEGVFTYRKTVCDDCYKKSIENTPLEEKLFKLVKSSAKGKYKRNMTHTLTTEEIKTQLESQDYKCFYTGRDLREVSASVDRIDSSIGYTKDNIVICDIRANIMKQSMNTEEFLEMIDLIYNNRKGKI